MHSFPTNKKNGMTKILTYINILSFLISIKKSIFAYKIKKKYNRKLSYIVRCERGMMRKTAK